jgi:hypothetical protein
VIIATVAAPAFFALCALAYFGFKPAQTAIGLGFLLVVLDLLFVGHAAENVFWVAQLYVLVVAIVLIPFWMAKKLVSGTKSLMIRARGHG